MEAAEGIWLGKASVENLNANDITGLGFRIEIELGLAAFKLSHHAGNSLEVGPLSVSKEIRLDALVNRSKRIRGFDALSRKSNLRLRGKCAEIDRALDRIRGESMIIRPQLPQLALD